MYKVSVIVTVYNIQDYLRQCIESILNQTYRNFELILVDDGSIDDSSSICDEYSKTDERVIVIHSTNKGVSNARNVGLQIATGDWIFFVDGDDWVALDALENLISKAQHGKEKDLIVGTCIKAYKDHEELDTSDDVKEALFNADSRMEDLLSACILNISSSPKMFPNDMKSGPQLTYPVLKLYRKDVIDNNKIQFDTSMSIGEDKLFNLNYISSCKHEIAFINKRVYYYRMRAGSASNDMQNRLQKIILYDTKIRDFLHDKSVLLPYKCLDYSIAQMYWKLLKGISENTSSANSVSRSEKKILYKNKNIHKCIRRVKLSDISRKKAKLIIILLKMHMDSLVYLLFYLKQKKHANNYYK